MWGYACSCLHKVLFITHKPTLNDIRLFYVYIFLCRVYSIRNSAIVKEYCISFKIRPSSSLSVFSSIITEKFCVLRGKNAKKPIKQFYLTQQYAERKTLRRNKMVILTLFINFEEKKNIKKFKKLLKNQNIGNVIQSLTV